MTYSVKEMFYTLQGEGAHAGTPAVFVRFAGCNLWSGREEDRERDAAKGSCARWCDTDFRGTDGVNGGRYSAVACARAAAEMWPTSDSRTAVLTGGEPTLQVDDALISALHAEGFAIHMETNGTRPVATGVDWATVSPKPPSMPIAQRYDEVKVIFDGSDVERWRSLAPRRSLQPLWSPDPDKRAESVSTCVAYVLAHPWWRLSCQIHKVLGVP